MYVKASQNTLTFIVKNWFETFENLFKRASKKTAF